MTDLQTNRRILVIDDNPDIHRDFRKVLAPAGSAPTGLDSAEAVLFGAPARAVEAAPFELDAAAQGEEGLAMVRAAAAAGRPYAVAFVDMRMPPGWDGLETITRLIPEDPRLQLVICTAFSDYSWQQIFDSVGRTDRLLIVKKPFDPVEVVQLAHALTAKWSLTMHRDGELGRLETAVAQRTRELSESNRALTLAASESRIAAEQLRRSENRFRAVIESAGSAIVIVDHRGVIWSWNPGAERIFGWTTVAAIGRGIASLLPGINSEDPGRSLQALLDASAGRHAPLELQARSGDGREMTIELGIASWRNDEGEFYSCIMQDIGPRKQAELAIRRARDAAEASARAKSDFLAIMSHELRTPMNGVIGMTDLLIESRLDPQQAEFAGTVRECALSLLRLIDDILDFSRFESGRIELESIPFDIRGVVEGVVDILEVQAQRKGLELVLEFDAAVPEMVEGDPTRLRQVVTNLVGNAVKFTQSGHVWVKVSRPDSGVDGSLRILVEDTGIGISHEAQGRLFQPFTQGDTSITRRHGGSGLGLAICRRLAELMRGTVAFSSEPGRGSRFWFDVPLPAHPAAGSRPARVAVPEQLRVLHVDGHAADRTAMRELLATWRMSCDSAPDPASGLAMAATAADRGIPYAVALVERALPDEDGLALVARLRESGGPPAILLARDAQPGLGSAARVAGAAGFLPMPVRRSHLYEAIVLIATGAGGGMITRHRLEEQRRNARPRVLLVDGDQDHRRMALGVLERDECRTDTIASGEAVVAACSGPGYALLLLDLDAEGIDGTACAARIRALRPSGHELGILAWMRTPDERRSATCLEAGIDAVIGRPDAAAFADCLRRMLPDTDRGELAGAPSSGIRAPAPIDEVRLERHILGGSRATVLDRLAESLPASVIEVILAVVRDRPQEVLAAAIALRRQCEEIGAYPLAAAAETMEGYGLEWDRLAAGHAAGELHAAMRLAVDEIRRLRREA